MNRDFKGIWIPKAIWLADLSCQEKCLWAEIHSLYNPEKEGCYATNEYLCDFIGVKERRLQEMLSNLKHLGWVIQVSFDGRSRIIKAVTPPEDFKPQVRAGQRCGKVHPCGAEKCTSDMQDPAPLPLYRDTTLDTNTPIVLKSKSAAKAASVGISSSSKTKRKKEEHIASDKAKDVLPKFIKVIKDFKPTYVVKNQHNMLASIDEMLNDGRTEEQILKVLAWAVKDNIIRGTWKGWSRLIIGSKNPAAYLCGRFEGIETESQAKKERKFAPCSDDAAAEASFDRMATL